MGKLHCIKNYQTDSIIKVLETLLEDIKQGNIKRLLVITEETTNNDPTFIVTGAPNLNEEAVLYLLKMGEYCTMFNESED